MLIYTSNSESSFLLKIKVLYSTNDTKEMGSGTLENEGHKIILEMVKYNIKFCNVRRGYLG